MHKHKRVCACKHKQDTSKSFSPLCFLSYISFPSLLCLTFSNSLSHHKVTPLCFAERLLDGKVQSRIRAVGGSRTPLSTRAFPQPPRSIYCTHAHTQTCTLKTLNLPLSYGHCIFICFNIAARASICACVCFFCVDFWCVSTGLISSLQVNLCVIVGVSFTCVQECLFQT